MSGAEHNVDPSLPIDAVIPEVIAALRARASVVVEAPPGAGKTTGLPLALLREGFADAGEIVVLQPRRLAARMAAQRVAELLGERLGERCGYQVRFESRVGPETRVRFMTEGLLTRRLRDDPTLAGVSVVVLDEFHERHLSGDINLALLKQLALGERPDLSIVVMSATLDGQPICDFLAAPDPRTGRQRPARRVVSEGRAFPVELEYSDAGDASRPLAKQVLRALHRLLEVEAKTERASGDVLVFLPGAREIREAGEACEGLARVHDMLMLPLHGELSPSEQDRAVRPAPSGQRKLILSTNVAETSVTIDGVVAVIDSGLHRLAVHDPWTGVASLQVRPIARDSATQRAGRAGRTRPGRCVRLYTRADHDRRPPHTSPELHRLDLASALLDLHAFGVTARALADFPWYQTPPAAALTAAQTLLRRLSATDEDGRLSATGRALLRYPVHPRLARLIVAGVERDIPALACGAAALLSERSIYRRQDRGPRVAARDADADLLSELEDLERYAARGADAARSLGLSVGACKKVLRVRDQLLRLARGRDRRGSRRSRERPANDEQALAAREAALCQAALLGFPDRIAQVRDEGRERVLVLSGGGAARLSPASVVRSASWVVALSVADRRSQRRSHGAGARHDHAIVDRACAIDPDWLLELELPDDDDGLAERDVLKFNPTRARVEGRSELRYGALVLTSTEYETLPPRASELLREAALAAGPARFVSDPAALSGLQARVRFARAHVPELADMPALDEARAREQLAALCEGCSSFAELERQDLLARLTALAQAAARARGLELDRVAPARVQLPGGRRVVVHYELDRPPWIASRLQDFFGMRAGPRVARDAVPLVLHLLAPNQRAVQVTTDLAGFWERHYPGLRKTLMRRYSKHAWPEDPLTAAPPQPRRRRRR